MGKVAGILSLLAITSLAYAGPVGATYTVVDTGTADVPGPQPIRVFPVPAAAGWSDAKLVYDNYAEGLGFSASQAREDFNWVGMPLSNSDVTIHRLFVSNLGTHNIARASCTPG